MSLQPPNHTVRLLTLSLSLCLSAVAYGQRVDSVKRQLNIDLEILGQGETRNGGFPTNSEKTADNSNFVVGRTRLIANYAQRGLDAKVIGQNSAVWGMKDNANFKLYEAWARLSTKFGLFAQIGRIALAYDDERIIGPNDWATFAMSHDALRLGFENKQHKAHLILAYNQNGEVVTDGGSYYSDGAQLYKTMQTLWYHFDVPSFPLGISVLAMNIGMQSGTKGKDEHVEWQQMVGGYAKFAPRHFSFEASYYRQMGKEEHGLELQAWMLALKAHFMPSDFYGLYAGYDYLSGDENFAVPAQGVIGLTRHEKLKGFSPVYGSHVKFYGAMDYFYFSSQYGSFTPGLQNAYAGGYVRPFKGFQVGAAYHYMAMATKLQDMNMTLGHEIELSASYKFSKDVQLMAGYSYMTGTKTMERLKRASDSGKLRWGWLALVVSPRIFTSK